MRVFPDPCASRYIIAVSLGLFFFSCRGVADDDEFTIGSKLPPLSKLMAVDGTEWDSKQLAAAKVVIIVFTCNQCPYSVDYEDRLNALHRKHSVPEGDVMLLVVNSNAGPDESLAQMKARAQEKQFEFPYVKDADQSVARGLGAVYTPEFFVFDRDRQLVYKGALDDATRFDEVRTNYVDSAVAALLAGNPVKTTKDGCTWLHDPIQTSTSARR
jgi:hypothetical protein